MVDTPCNLLQLRELILCTGAPSKWYSQQAGWAGSVVWVCQPGQVVGLVDIVKMANLVEMVAESEPGKDYEVGDSLHGVA